MMPARNSVMTASTCSAVLAVWATSSPRPPSAPRIRCSPQVTTPPGSTRISHSKTGYGMNGAPRSQAMKKMPSNPAVSKAPAAKPVNARTIPFLAMNDSPTPPSAPHHPRTPEPQNRRPT